MRRDVLVRLREREASVRERLGQARERARALRKRVEHAASPDAGPYRSDQGEPATPATLAEAVADEDTLLREREAVRRGLADVGIHTSLPRPPTTNAAGCPARWGEMAGDDRSRVCGRCRQRLYDVDGLSTDAIDALIAGFEPAPARLFRRADGSLMSSDCPLGRRRTRNAAIAGVASVTVLAAVCVWGGRVREPAGGSSGSRPGSAAAVTRSPDGGVAPRIVVDESKLSPAERAYVEAAVVHPNRAKRLEAARAIVKTKGWSLWMSYDRADYAALRDELDRSKTTFAHDEAVLDGAILNGDREALSAVVRAAPTKDGKSWVSYEVRVGALRCLLGDPVGGMAALRDADKLARSDAPPFEPNDHVHPAQPYERAGAHLAAIACGSPLEPPETDVALVSEEAALRTLGVRSPPPRYGNFDPFDDLVRAAVDPKGSVPALSKRSIELLEARFLTPRTILGDGRWRTPTLPLAGVESAAARGGKQATAYFLWLAAASERIRRGDAVGARTDVERAEASAPPDALPATVPLRILLGDASGATSLAERAWTSRDWGADDRMELLLWRSLARIASSDWIGARDRARELSAAIADNEPKRPPWRQWNTIAAWLRAALDRRAGAPASPDLPADIRTWASVPSAPEATRRAFRLSEALYHMTVPRSDVDGAPVHGVTLYVLGGAAAGDGDVDVWLEALDIVLPPWRLFFADRAMAARMRGDEAASKQWLERSARWTSLIHDDATAVLASLAGL